MGKHAALLAHKPEIIISLPVLRNPGPFCMICDMGELLAVHALDLHQAFHAHQKITQESQHFCNRRISSQPV